MWRIARLALPFLLVPSAADQAIGRTAPFVSPGVGLSAAPSSSTSLRHSPDALVTHITGAQEGLQPRHTAVYRSAVTVRCVE